MAGAVSAAAAPRAAWGKPPGQLVLPQHAPVRTAVWLLSERFRSGQCCSSLPPLFAVRSRRWFEQHADETWPNGDRPSIQHAWDHCKCLRTLDQVGGGGCPGAPPSDGSGATAPQGNSHPPTVASLMPSRFHNDQRHASASRAPGGSAQLSSSRTLV